MILVHLAMMSGFVRLPVIGEPGSANSLFALAPRVVLQPRGCPETFSSPTSAPGNIF